MARYGSEPTRLQLGAMAQWVYNETDPMLIEEHEDNGIYWYAMLTDRTDGFQGHYTADELTDQIMAFAEGWEFILNSTDPQDWGKENGDPVTLREVRKHARKMGATLDDLVDELM